MFDLIADGRRQALHAPTVGPVAVSIVGHVIALAVLVGLPLMYATERLPNVPQMMAFVADMPAPPPPPPAAAPARKAIAKAAQTPRPAAAPTSSALAAPVEAPAEIRPEPQVLTSDIEGAVEGGLEGGVAGGIIGGLVASPPPPPAKLEPPVEAKGPVRIGGNLQAPALLMRVEPVYPEAALRAKVSGIVILEAVVGANGSVESVQLLRSVKLLDNAAIAAVKQWKYSPLVLNGTPTRFALTVTLSFSTAASR